MRWATPCDRRAVVVGFATLLLLALTYPFYARSASWPLAVFVLPGLLAAVLGGWRSTVLVGTVTMVVAIGESLIEPIGATGLVVRWLTIASSVAAGAAAAGLRERQAGLVATRDQTIELLDAFTRGLAPTPLPGPGFAVAARYQPADARMQLGGDFLDAIALPDGRLAVLIGDVCGHGPRQAALGAALRAGWKAIALGDKHDPADWVQALHDAFFLDERVTTYTTLCTGYLDRTTRAARLVNAGHPAPIALTYPAAPLNLPPCPPLGLNPSRTWTATEITWAGHPLLLYTDGLVENPMTTGRARRWDHTGLLDWLNSSRPDPARPGPFLDCLIATATTGRDLRDDIAALLVTGT